MDLTDTNDTRLNDLGRWLESEAGVTVVRMEPASADASFRRYFRVFTDDDRYIAMDAPPPQESCEPFVRIAGFLQDIGLNSPRVICANLDDGYLLLSDLGERQYLDELSTAPEKAPRLYTDAIDALRRLQQEGSKYQSRLPPYDAALLETELSLFRDWLCGRHLGIEFSEREQRGWRRCCEWLVDQALAQPRVFVHRDYHSRNLMVCADDNPGILDFQDAVEGPLTYDLVSLLKDCYVRWPADMVKSFALDHYRVSHPLLSNGTSEADFTRAFDAMGVQRHLKAAGIFARLHHRDGKSAYLADVPRTLGYITELGARYAELGFLAEFIDARCLPGLSGS